MCRNAEQSGRRCPCDTSEARQLRRKNAGARSAYAVLVQEPVESKALPVVEKAEPFTVESLKKDINSLNDLATDLHNAGATSSVIRIAYDKKLNQIGAGVEYLAETKYGAPTDTEMNEKVAAALADRQKRLLQQEMAMNKQNYAVHALKDELEKIANFKTHPIIKERREVWAKEAPETYAASVEAEEAYTQLTRKFFDDRRDSSELVAVKRELLEKRNEAMLSALTDVGVKFADPDSVLVSEDSHKDAVKSLKKALKFYPQSWVDASNAEHGKRELRVKRSKGRAHYSAGKTQKKYESKTRAMLEEKRADWRPDPHDRRDSEYVEVDESGIWTDPRSGVMKERWNQTNEVTKAWVAIRYEYYQGNGKPSKAWEPVQLHETAWVDGKYVRTGNLVTEYRKPLLEKMSASWEYKAELTVSKDREVLVGDDAGMRVAMHEFAHRVEHTSPQVAVHEDGFLSRRAGRLTPEAGSSTVSEYLTPIYEDKKSEVGYKDNFPSHYMGKVYAGSSYREILSMGMESVFAGTHGGLAGMGNYKADPDYKKFILGVLASSAK